jgi:hypothetical protein
MSQMSVKSDRTDRDDIEEDQVGILALLQAQNEKLDTLLERTSSLAAVKQDTDHGDFISAASKQTLSKRLLPLFQAATSAFFCSNAVGIATELPTGQAAQERRIPLNDDSSSPRTIVSILNGQIIDGVSNDLSTDDVDAFRIATAPECPNMEMQYGRLDRLEDVEPGLLLKAIQLFDVMESPLYPIFDLRSILHFLHDLVDGGGRKRSPSGSRRELTSNSLDKGDSELVKMSAAIGLLALGDEYRHVASKLLQSVQPLVQELVWSAAVDMKEITFLILVVKSHAVGRLDGIYIDDRTGALSFPLRLVASGMANSA